jgi:hypothetical protein
LTDRAAARLLASRLIGLLVVPGATFCLFFLVIYGIAGVGYYALLPCACFFVLLVSGIGTLLGQRPARLALSALLPLQACWLIGYVILKTPRQGQVCDFSCYAGPLEAVALPVVLSLIAAWVVYPGRTHRI